MADARQAAALAALVVALASGIKDYRGTWNWLSGQHRQFAGMSAQARAQEPGTAQLLPVDAFDFFRARVHRGDRYFLAVEAGAFATGVSREQAGRIFGRFYLLPAVQVADPQHADVVLTVGIDPRTLGVPLGTVQKFGGGNYFVADVQ